MNIVVKIENLNMLINIYFTLASSYKSRNYNKFWSDWWINAGK